MILAKQVKNTLSTFTNETDVVADEALYQKRIAKNLNRNIIPMGNLIREQ